jgi:hypothetical protein
VGRRQPRIRNLREALVALICAFPLVAGELGLLSLGSQIIAKQVNRDAIEPVANVSFPTECVEALPRPQKGLLSEVFRESIILGETPQVPVDTVVKVDVEGRKVLS